MNLYVALPLAVLAGAGLGLLHFGGLWLTVRRLAASRSPVLLVGASFLARTLLAVAGFYLVMDGSLARALACLLGFIVARQLLVALLGPGRAPAGAREREDTRP
jgi:F1F0 ATPase subunit 2